MLTFLNREFLACFLGICVGALAAYTLLPKQSDYLYGVNESDKYHIHVDFLIQIEDDLIDLGTTELMTTASQRLHEHAHLHDDDGDVLHMHEENISFVEFLNSLEINLTSDCLLLSGGEKFCENDTESINLFVNDELWTGDLASYTPQDLDRVLLYYGDTNTSVPKNYLDAVPNDACIYSGSCPERGTAPAESCGLTCEL